MNLKESKEGYVGDFRDRKGKEEMNAIVISKINENKSSSTVIDLNLENTFLNMVFYLIFESCSMSRIFFNLSLLLTR